MKKTFKTLLSDRRGLALITVVGTLALATILLMAIFSVTQVEYKATQSFAAAQSAKQLADAATAIVQAQIQNGQNTTTGAARTTHATQPGLVRVYTNTGTFKEAYKLYSSSTMKETTEANLNTDVPPADWNSAANAARYVDLNEPVVRPPLVAGPGGKPSLFFPIIDPRAAYNFLGSQTPATGTPTTQVEGFSYSQRPATVAGGTDISGIVLPTAGTDVDLRLPMPVEWIYQLQDGTLGTLNASNQFVSATPGRQATVNNPIVGRIAFWTDDESCKININTASEPTYAGTPYYYHERDRRWAHFPASSSEYQRYPGHPATVALSAVLYPGNRLDPYAPEGGLTMAEIIDIKEKIYEFAPKVEVGGSKSGSRPFGLDAVSTGEELATLINTNESMKERLYASVDEMLFKDGDYNATTGRMPTQAIVSGRNLFDHDVLERSRFFLTANSRAPEFSIHGLPRIAMWPIADETQGNSKRTNFDNLIALCATLKSGKTGAAVENSYIFRRGDAHYSTYDLTGAPPTGSGLPNSSGLQRNTKLLEYLERQMSQLSFPRTGSGNFSNYVQKYGQDNVRQLAVSIFDYVRCINLYDGMLARENDGTAAAALDLNNDANYPTFYRMSTGNNAIPYKTFTNPRATPAATSSIVVSKSDDTRVIPGHGVVSPAVWTQGGTNYKGFGRMLTLSEVGIQFICTADGLNDAHAVDFNGVRTGGQSAARIGNEEDGFMKTNSTAQEYQGKGYRLPPNGSARWYSNFPPLSVDNGAATPSPSGTMISYYGANAATPNHPFHPARHPAFTPQFWNFTLDEDTPLKQDEKRVQAIIQLEAFCPSLGWTKFFPEFTIVVDGNYISQIEVNGDKIFNTTGPIPLKSKGSVFEATNVHSLGGSSGVDALVGGRHGRKIGALDSDPGYESSLGDNNHTGLNNMNLTSKFFTVKRDQPMSIRFPNGPLRIEIWDTHDTGNAARRPIQTLDVQFPPTLETLTPNLVGAEDTFVSAGGPTQGAARFRTWIDSNGNRRYARRREGPHYWCFNWGGCVDRMAGSAQLIYSTGNGQPLWVGLANKVATQRVRGRLDTDWTNREPGFNPVGSPDAAPSTVPPLPNPTVGESPTNPSYDIIRTVIPAMGDYRTVAALQHVPASMWYPHPSWARTDLRTAHNFSRHMNDVSGSRIVSNVTGAIVPNILVSSVSYTFRNGDNSVNYGRVPDLPNDPNVSRVANAFGDFDAGIGSARDGAYINKPDEGNFWIGNISRNNISKNYRAAYFYDTWNQTDDWRSGIFMTPNRLVSSPVMFGSLPTAVWPGSGVPGSGQGVTPTPIGGQTYSPLNANTSYQPWQTLLFRAYAKNIAGAGSQNIHPGERNPMDHYLLDMFFMPVVEPYAISEPLSEAGKININYQIMPFSYIRRATAMHALLKGEFMTAIPNADIIGTTPGRNPPAKSFKGSAGDAWSTPLFFSEADGKYWHRPIDPKETLLQFDERMNFKDTGLVTTQRGLFRSPSQICETHLIPATGLGTGDPYGSGYFSGLASAAARKARMETFWQGNASTGENIRERPYSNLYSRITTRSNTFRVHVRAQVIKKARSTDADTFDAARDAVLSEYRGSTVLERFIDPTDTSKPIPDYAESSNPLGLAPLDTFYQFRTIESKRFAP